MSKCLGCDISVRQHSKSEHWAPCHIQTLSQYGWKIVESDFKPKSNKQNLKFVSHVLLSKHIFIYQYVSILTWYSKTSMTRTPMTRLLGWFELVFESLQNSSKTSRKQIIWEISLFYHEIVCCVYSLELPNWGLISILNILLLYRRSKRLSKIITLHHD